MGELAGCVLLGRCLFELSGGFIENPDSSFSMLRGWLVFVRGGTLELNYSHVPIG